MSIAASRPMLREKDVHVTAIGDWCFRRKAEFLTCVATVEPRGHVALPANPSGFEIDVVEHPPMRVPDLPAVFKTRQALDRCRLAAAGDGGRDEHVVVPDDRRAPPETWNGDPPGDVFGLAPGVGQRRVVGHDASLQPPKLRPLVCGRCAHCESREDQAESETSAFQDETLLAHVHRMTRVGRL